MKKVILRIGIGLGIVILLFIILLTYTVIVTSKQNVSVNNKMYVGNLKYSKSGHIIVDVKINGSNKTYPFILDNGAGTVVFDNLLSEFEFSIIAYTPSRDVNRNISFNPVFRIDTLIINKNIIVTNASAGLHNSNIFKCDTKIYGIIGRDIMKKLIWQFDFEKSKYYITDDIKNLEFKKDTFSINFKSKGIINVLINNQENEMLIDLGSTSSLKHEVRIKKNDMFFKNKWLKIFGNTGFGINGYENSIKTSQVFVDSLTINSHKFFNIDGVIAEKTANIVGLDFLKNFNLTFDFKKNKIIFSQNSQFEFRKKHFGFIPIIKDSLLQIGTLYEGSILDKEGIKIGDEITKINDIDIDENFNLCDFEAYKYDTLNISIKIFNEIKDYQVIRRCFFE